MQGRVNIYIEQTSIKIPKVAVVTFTISPGECIQTWLLAPNAQYMYSRGNGPCHGPMPSRGPTPTRGPHAFHGPQAFQVPEKNGLLQLLVGRMKTHVLIPGLGRGVDQRIRSNVGFFNSYICTICLHLNYMFAFKLYACMCTICMRVHYSHSSLCLADVPINTPGLKPCATRMLPRSAKRFTLPARLRPTKWFITSFQLS